MPADFELLGDEKIAIAQLNYTVGDIDGNTAKIVEAIQGAKSQGVDLIVFSEMAITGYPPKDLLLKEAFVTKNEAALNTIAVECDGITAIVGCVTRNLNSSGKPLYNSAAVCSDGRVKHLCYKTQLPTYDVFDERRYFEAAEIPLSPVSVKIGKRDVKVVITICEDLWNDEKIIGRIYYKRPYDLQSVADYCDIIVNISASPYWVDKFNVRHEVFLSHSSKTGKMLIFANQVGGNDDLVFDGASMVFDGGPRMIQMEAFEENITIIDSGSAHGEGICEYPVEIESIYRALVMGVRDYVVKSGFERVVIGLSGGIDSAVTAAIAQAALGSENVHGITMPSEYSSEGSVSDSKSLANALEIKLSEIPIKDAMNTLIDTYKWHIPLKEVEHVTGQVSLTEENMQARIRGLTLMAWSNYYRSLVLTTGNKSELAVGYCTLYGDMNGGLAVLSDVPKTTVYELAKYINYLFDAEIIPRLIITKPPSAELRPGQFDDQSLPPYEVLDKILEMYVEQNMSIAAIAKTKIASEDVVRDVVGKVDRNEHKRYQAAVGIKVTSRAFGSGRRMPIAARFES